jgi:hypothetical protein
MHYENISKKEDIKSKLPYGSRIDDSYTLINKLVEKKHLDEILKMDDILFNNYLHIRLYTSNDPIGWSYRTVISILYDEYIDKKIDNQDIAQKVKAISEKNISFSANSVRGARNFIDALGAIPEGIFKPRDFCQCNLMICALDYEYNKMWNGEYNSLMYLNAESVDESSRFCLIKSKCFGKILSQSEPVYDFLELTTKLLGNYIRLSRQYTVKDILGD